MKALLVLLAACAGDVEDLDAIYATNDGERVLCGLGVDSANISVDALEAGMQRARERDEVMILFAHQPTRTIDPDRVENILAAADRVGLPFVTFPELAGARHAGLSFGFDDWYVDNWMSLRDTLRGRPVTFFVSNWHELAPADIETLHALAADGHAIEAHGMGHRDAALYVDRYGLDRYLRDEIDPLVELMRRDGFSPATFAYPYGSRTNEIDRALLSRFALVRSLTYLYAGAVASSPCPY